MFLGAGSVMHGMNDDVNMRHYGGLARADADHLRHLRGRLPGDHRLPVLRRLLLQGPHHRGRVRAQRGDRPAGPARRRGDRLLHDPADADDLLRQAALAARGAPARVAAGDDGAADHPGRGLGGRRPAAEQLDRRLAGPGRRRRARRGDRPAALLARSAVATLVVVAVGVAISVWLFGPRRDIPRTQPASTLALRPRRAQRPVRRRVQRGGVHASRPAADRRSGPVGGLRHRRHGRTAPPPRSAACPAGCAGSRTASSARTR